jgi:hypothetical protein
MQALLCVRGCAGKPLLPSGTRATSFRTDRQAAALFLIAPMSAVSMAPPAPPATTCEITPLAVRLPDWAAATTDGSNNVTTWPRTPPPTRPEMMLPAVPRSNVGDDLPAPNAAKRSCNKVYQNLLHFDLRMLCNNRGNLTPRRDGSGTGFWGASAGAVPLRRPLVWGGSSQWSSVGLLASSRIAQQPLI